VRNKRTFAHATIPTIYSDYQGALQLSGLYGVEVRNKRTFIHNRIYVPTIHSDYHNATEVRVSVTALNCETFTYYYVQDDYGVEVRKYDILNNFLVVITIRL